uniref:CASC1 C-terminal domain-containing protein n=1 Tax=Timema bartmani TaxID=61472 RepID=A0A7R9I307_9NEOP|nr:unnamed protein product [Timema bartmani]
MGGGADEVPAAAKSATETWMALVSHAPPSPALRCGGGSRGRAPSGSATASTGRLGLVKNLPYDAAISSSVNLSNMALMDAPSSPPGQSSLMSRGGVDLFPPFDAMCYVEGDASKHHEAEDHLYHTMAILSTTHNFSWSRWNLLAGRRNMVLQMREFKDRKKLGLNDHYNIFFLSQQLEGWFDVISIHPVLGMHSALLLTNYNILHVTPLKACFVDCTEVSQAFTEQGVQGMKGEFEPPKLPPGYGLDWICIQLHTLPPLPSLHPRTGPDFAVKDREKGARLIVSFILIFSHWYKTTQALSFKKEFKKQTQY